MPQTAPRSPQTVALLDLLGLPYNLDPAAPPLALQPLGGTLAAGQPDTQGSCTLQGCACAKGEFVRMPSIDMIELPHRCGSGIVLLASGQPKASCRVS